MAQGLFRSTYIYTLSQASLRDAVLKQFRVFDGKLGILGFDKRKIGSSFALS